MKYTLSLFTLLFLNTIGYAQKFDYLALRDSVTTLSCGPSDSMTVAKANLELRNIDTNQIENNMDLYYSDLGWSYYRLFLIHKDTSFIRSSIDNYRRADHHKPNVSGTCWELLGSYYILGDCDQGKYYLEKYKSVTNQQDWEEDQIKLITRNCNNLTSSTVKSPNSRSFNNVVQKVNGGLWASISLHLNCPHCSTRNNVELPSSRSKWIKNSTNVKYKI